MGNSKTQRKERKTKTPLHERSGSARHDVLAELGRRGTWPGHAPGSMIHTRCNLHSPAGGRRGLAARAGSIPAGPITTRSAAERNGRFGWRLAAPRPSRTLRHQPGARRRRLVNTQAPGTARGYIGGAVLRSLAFRFYSQLGARLAQPASGPSLRGAAREEKGEETRASSSRLGHRHWLGLVARSGLLRPHAS